MKPVKMVSQIRTWKLKLATQTPKEVGLQTDDQPYPLAGLLTGCRPAPGWTGSQGPRGACVQPRSLRTESCIVRQVRQVEMSLGIIPSDKRGGGRHGGLLVGSEVVGDVVGLVQGPTWWVRQTARRWVPRSCEKPLSFWFGTLTTSDPTMQNLMGFGTKGWRRTVSHRSPWPAARRPRPTDPGARMPMRSHPPSPHPPSPLSTSTRSPSEKRCRNIWAGRACEHLRLCAAGRESPPPRQHSAQSPTSLGCIAPLPPAARRPHPVRKSLIVEHNGARIQLRLWGGRVSGSR